MTTQPPIKTLFANDIHRRIEEVIKVDQTDEEKDLDLSELEITLEEKGQLSRFEEEYKRLFKKDWSLEKGKVAFALSEASRVLHSLESETYGNRICPRRQSIHFL
jgi:hypothetical protein